MTVDSNTPFVSPLGTAEAPIYAVVGASAGTVAYNLAGVLIEKLKGESQRALLVDAEGRVSREILPKLDSHSIHNASSELRTLPYPRRDALPAAGLIKRLRKEFDALFVACGCSQYAIDWLAAADRVVVSSESGRELNEALKSVEQLRGTDLTLLAPIGGFKVSDEWLEHPIFRLLPSRSSAFEEAEKAGKFAVLADEEVGKAFEQLLEKLLNTSERSHPAPHEGTVCHREESAMSSENTPEVLPTEPTGDRNTARLSADEFVEKSRRGVRDSGDSNGEDDSESGHECPDEPPRSRLGRLKGGISAFAGRLHGHDEGAPHDTETSAKELECRLKLSLRETAVGGISRVCVGSPKGGVGKSSIAYALAGSIAYYTNLRVCLVDADPNFGSTRLLVPRPVEHSMISLAEGADKIESLSDVRAYVAQNEKMRLDIVLSPEKAHEMIQLPDLGTAYDQIDSVLSKFYDLVVYDLGLGFRDPVIRRVLSLSDELLLVTDSEIIPNAMLAEATQYVENLGVDLARTMLVLNHRLPVSDESAVALRVRNAHASLLRRVTEIPYDAEMSLLLNQRSFHIEELSLPTRLGVLTTVAACLEGLRGSRGPADKVMAQSSGKNLG